MNKTLFEEVEYYLAVHYNYLEIRLVKELKTKYKIELNFVDSRDIVMKTEIDKSLIDKSLQQNKIKEYCEFLDDTYYAYYKLQKLIMKGRDVNGK